MADTTCDGKKKMYELLAAYKPVVLLQLPQIQDGDAKDYWRAQYAKLAARLEKDFGVSITTDDLRNAVRLTNRLRRALKDVLDLAKRKPSPLTGMDLLDICFRASFMPDYEQAIALLQDIAAEIGGRVTGPFPRTRPASCSRASPRGWAPTRSSSSSKSAGEHRLHRQLHLL